MDLFLDDRTQGDWTVIEVKGELDLATAPALRERIDALEDTGAARLAVDLTVVTFMDSSSLGVLVAALKHARERGGDLVLIGVGDSPARVLSLTGLDQVFRIVATVDALPSPG